MRIVVLGGGVVGVASAHHLARDGHDVVLVERDRALAAAASGVNAGLIVPSDAVVWPSLHAVRLLAASALGRASPLRVRPGAGAALLPWGARFLLECPPRRSRAGSAAMHRLSALSRDLLVDLLDGEGIECAREDGGVVFLFRSRAALEAALAARAPLLAGGEELRVLTPAELAGLDPAYARVAPALFGALHAPSSFSADSAAFARGLADRSPGVQLRLGTAVRLLRVAGGRVRAAETDGGDLDADAFVLACGAWSAPLARSAGVRLSLVPAAGFSITAELLDPAAAPRVAGIDEERHVAFSRVGGALRVSSTVEFRGFDQRIRPHDHDAIVATAGELFGAAADWAAAPRAGGFRPATPAGRPLIGPTRVPGLWLNTGHGHLGWTQACGSARVLADLMAGRRPPIDPSPFLPAGA